MLILIGTEQLFMNSVKFSLASIHHTFVLYFLFQFIISSHWHSITCCRFPSLAKASKLGTSDLTPPKGSLTSGKLNLPQNDTSTQPQTEVDLV